MSIGKRDIVNCEIAGDSIMRGVYGLLSEAPAAYATERAKLWIQQGSNLNTPATIPLQYLTDLRGSNGTQDSLNSSTIGIELPMGHRYLDLTGNELVLHKWTVPGGSMGATFATNPLADELDDLNAAVEDFLTYRAAGSGMRVAEQICLFGAFAGDAVTDELTDAVAANITAFKANRRAQRGRNMRFVFVMPSANSNLDSGRVEHIQDVIRAEAESDPFVKWVNIDAVPLHTDDLHYFTLGQIGIGFGAAEAMAYNQNIFAVNGVV